MRQAGVLAAAGLVALEQMTSRLQEDHDNARLLAEGLTEIPGITADPGRVQTNIVLFDVSATGLAADAFTRCMKERGVLAGSVGPRRIRLVTHYDVSAADCLMALGAIRDAAKKAAAGGVKV
jgi:threonine aldolase